LCPIADDIFNDANEQKKKKYQNSIRPLLFATSTRLIIVTLGPSAAWLSALQVISNYKLCGGHVSATWETLTKVQFN